MLPRLSRIKFDSGVIDELLFLDMPHEYRLASGVLLLEYAKATQQTVYDHLRVVREGQLRIKFTPDLKVCIAFFPPPTRAPIFSARNTILMYEAYHDPPILQILSWEFCARRHEELLPRRLVAPQVSFFFSHL